MSPTGYVDWLKARLREFQVVQDSGLELHLTKLAAGDAYRLHVTLVPGTGITHVHLQLTATPD